MRYTFWNTRAVAAEESSGFGGVVCECCSRSYRCEEAVARIIKLTKNRKKDLKEIQVGFIALNKAGEYGSYCIQTGFNYAVYDETGNQLIDADSFLK